MIFEKGQIKFELPRNLANFDSYSEDPCIVFEKNELLDCQAFQSLSDEVNQMDSFDGVFSGLGSKKKTSIGGHNISKLEESALKDFCNAFLSDNFFDWFNSTHLPYFKSGKLKIYVKNKNSRRFRIARKIRDKFSLAISFYYTEIEYSSISRGGFIPPHTDASRKRLSFVFYLPRNGQELSEEMSNVLGTAFWALKNPDSRLAKRFDCKLLNASESEQFFKDFEKSFVAKFEGNKVVGFIKSDRSWHSVDVNKYDYDRRAIVVNVWEG